MNEKPVIADNKPVGAEVEKDKKYAYCTCGKSLKQPFCDGSHVGTSFVPSYFTAKESGLQFFCSCKHTSNPPYCDGSHVGFTDDDIGKVNEEETATQTIKTPTNTKEEPHVAFIHELAKNRLDNYGHHGPVASMGVPNYKLPSWDDIQIMTAQLGTKPLMEDTKIDTSVIIGPKAKRPLKLDIPIFVSDMSFGALSQESKIAMAKGANLAGTGICSGEGGMLPEEQEANSKYFFELASAQFGYSESALSKVQAFHFKCGQGAKTGIGGHLPGSKNKGKISEIRGIPEGVDAVSPPTFEDIVTVEDFKEFANKVREVSDGIPIGFKLSANHIEQDIEFALEAGADYIILDGRGGGTGAAPELFRDHISVPTIPALARARKFLNEKNASDKVTLIITGGLRTPSDYIKALALGADAIAVSNSALQAIGCVGARMCNTNNCPAGIATQDPELRKNLNIDDASIGLLNFLESSIELMNMMARACGHKRLSEFNINDLSTWKKEMAELSGVKYSGIQFK